MPLFDAVPGALRWDEVWELLGSGVRENELLDYKEYPGLSAFENDKNKRVLKTMAAMANTHGGAIIYGVAEKETKSGASTGAPDVPNGLKGVPESDLGVVEHAIEEQNWTLVPPIQGLSVERVEVDPSVAPEGAKGLMLLVIRVPRSDAAPHFVPGFGHYGRAGSHNGQFNDVPLSTAWFERLLRNREQSTDCLRGMLRFIDGLDDSPVWHTVWCAPRYPWKALWPDVDEKTLEATCPRIREPDPDGQESGQSALPCEHRRYGDVQSALRAVQHGWMWQAWGLQQVPLPPVRLSAGGSESCRPFCTYLVDERGMVAMRGLSLAEAASYRETHPLHPDPYHRPAFDWAYITAGLLEVVRHASRLYAKYGFRGEVEFGVQVGVDVSRFGGPALLATSIQPLPGQAAIWSDTLSFPHPGTRLLMSSPGGRVTETDTALSRDIEEAILRSPLHRRWVRAFGYAPGQQDTEAFVTSIGSLVT